MFFRRTECCNFVHNSTPYIHPRPDLKNWPRQFRMLENLVSMLAHILSSIWSSKSDFLLFFDDLDLRPVFLLGAAITASFPFAACFGVGLEGVARNSELRHSLGSSTSSIVMKRGFSHTYDPATKNYSNTNFKMSPVKQRCWLFDAEEETEV